MYNNREPNKWIVKNHVSVEEILTNLIIQHIQDPVVIPTHVYMNRFECFERLLTMTLQKCQYQRICKHAFQENV